MSRQHRHATVDLFLRPPLNSRTAVTLGRCSGAEVCALLSHPVSARIVVQLEQRHGEQFEIAGHGKLREFLQKDEENFLLLLRRRDVSGHVGILRGAKKAAAAGSSDAR